MNNSFMSFMEKMRKLSCGKEETFVPGPPTKIVFLLEANQKTLLLRTHPDKLKVRSECLSKIASRPSKLESQVSLECRVFLRQFQLGN